MTQSDEKPDLLMTTFRQVYDVPPPREEFTATLRGRIVGELDRTAGERAATPRDAAGRPSFLRKGLVAAAAAILFVAAAIWFLLPARYPKAGVEGDFLITRGSQTVSAAVPERGDRIIARSEGARVKLGGYCDLALSPDAEVVIGGAPGRESVELDRGELRSHITPKRGEYRVVTPLGSLDVIGTEFLTAVTNLPTLRTAGKPSVAVVVTVLSGIVAFDFNGETGRLAAGESRTFSAPAAPAPAVLEGLTPEQQKAAEALIKDFSSKEFDVRQKAVEKLIAMGKGVIPLVKKALAETDDAEVKMRCQMVLKALVATPAKGAGDDAARKAKIAHLLEDLSDEDAGVPSQAAKSLGEMGPVALMRDHPNRNNKMMLTEDEEKEVTLALIKALDDPVVVVRREAAAAIGDIGWSSSDAVPALIKALGDKDRGLRTNAATALGEIGYAAESAVPALIKALEDPEVRVRREAALAFGGIREEAKEAVPALIKAMGEEDSVVRKWAVFSLGCIGPAAKDAVPGIIKALTAPDDATRFQAAQALGSIGAVTKEVVPALIKTLDQPDARVREMAASALCQIWEEGPVGPEGKDAIGGLIKQLGEKGDENECLRADAAKALGLIGPQAKDAIPELERIAENDPYFYARLNARQALEKIRK